MQIYYISPSILPSLSANSVHVIRQTHALADIGHNITLFACSSVSASKLTSAIRQQYGIDLNGVQILTVPKAPGFGINLRIALRSIRSLLSSGWPDLIISRNLYASFLIGVLARHPLVVEIHDLETGLRGRLQCSILRQPWIKIVAISEKMLEFLIEHHRVSPATTQILHDAAPSDMVPIPRGHQLALLRELVPEAEGAWDGVGGYFGNLYPGRGVEIIEMMAASRPNMLFLVAGGQHEDVIFRRTHNALNNLVFLGHLPHERALRLAGCVDVLLMPYQVNVSIGVAGRDTAKWMSPLKMFEYMASGVPLISSDLPVLREVLQHEENALLVQPDDTDSWLAAVDKMIEDKEFASRLANSAYIQYRNHHTWEQRAHALVCNV